MGSGGGELHTRSISEWLCLWSGLAAIALVGAGFLIGNLLPPPSPADTAAEAAAFWRETPDSRRIGLVLMVVGSTLFVPFAVAIAVALRRVEGPGSPMALVQVAGGTITAATAVVYEFIMLAIVYRPELPDTTIQALSTVAWIAFVGLWTPGALQGVAVGVATLGSRGQTALPRWAGWFSLWMAFTSLSGSLVPFLRDGPFAWNGFLGFYVAATVFFLWYLVMTYALWRAARR